MASRSSARQTHIACVDLFCGAGGLTYGLRSAGIPVVAGVDFDEACRYPYESNNPGANFHERDIVGVESSEVDRWLGGAEVRVLAGCAPCQPFSSYSQRYETVGTERWALLAHFSRLVEGIRPHVVTMENVPTVTKHAVFLDFVGTLERLGYKVWYSVVDAADYGLPQRRRRTVLLASRLGEIKLRAPLRSGIRTVGEALRSLPLLRQGGCNRTDPLHTASTLSLLNRARIKASKPGGTWRDWPEDLLAACHRKDTGKSYPGVYGRMRWDEPAPTLTTQFYGFGSGRFGHPTQARALSLREGAILQGFPRNYSFVPKNERIRVKVLGRLIGNAVPVQLGKAIGETIASHVKKHQVSRLPAPKRSGGRSGRGRPRNSVHA